MFTNPLARDVTVVLAIKTIILLAAAVLVFGPQEPRIDAPAVRAHLDAPPATGDSSP